MQDDNDYPVQEVQDQCSEFNQNVDDNGSKQTCANPNKAAFCCGLGYCFRTLLVGENER
jgi:hypothetical protein